MSILIAILTFVLILISLFLILVVLAQKAKNDGGMGAAMGGGMAEAAFGADTSNVLSKATINAAIAFFVLAFGLYLARIYVRNHEQPAGGALPAITAPATTAPEAAQPAPAVSVPATGTTPESATTTPPTTAPATTPPATEAPKN